MLHRFLSIVFLVTSLAMVGCGGGGGGGGGASPAPEVPPADDPEDGEDFQDQPVIGVLQPVVLQSGGAQSTSVPASPVYATPTSYHIGYNARPSGTFSDAGNRNGIALREGTSDDVSSASDVVAYLENQVLPYDSYSGLVKFNNPPVVQIEGSATEKQRKLTEFAVKIVNTALPHDKRLRIASDYAYEAEGRIGVTFSAEPPPESDGKYNLGTASANFWYVDEVDPDTQLYRVAEAGAIWGKVTIYTSGFTGEFDSDRYKVAVLIHEILHAMGMLGHIPSSQFPNSVLTDTLVQLDGDSFLFEGIDRHALFAAYDRLPTGLQPSELTVESLGSWSSSSAHLLGEFQVRGGTARFGAAFANGLPQPWAYGPKPSQDLANNEAISGTVAWSGALVGYTPDEAKIVGEARLDIALQSLDGRLEFTDLEDFEGNRWDDGDLRYTVEVESNFFTRTGGDAGTVQGAFVGSGHEGMVGVLERQDLAAGFGGRRGQ